MHHFCVLTVLLWVANVYSSPYLSGCYFTSWYSNEHGYPEDVLEGYPMTGMGCHGEHCNDLRAQQCTTVENDDESLNLYGSVCEELPFTFNGRDSSGWNSCPDGMFAESIKCEEDYCSNLRLRCCQSSTWFPDYSRKLYTPWFKDNGSQVCQPTYAVVGGLCDGLYCDSMLVTCAPMVVLAKAGLALGSWVAVCSTNDPDHPCDFVRSTSVTRQRQSTWDQGFTDSVEKSISLKVLFQGHLVSLQSSVVVSVAEMVATGQDTSLPCSMHPIQSSNLTETAWWQWVMDVEDISLTDLDGVHYKLHITTCYFLQTSGLDKNPKCTPGNCADLDCQVCTA